MHDVLMMIHDSLLDDPVLAQEAAGRIKFYEYPQTGDVTAPYVVIDPLDAPLPADYADNTWLTYDYLIQIDVWSKNRQKTRLLSQHIQERMWDLGFGQYGGAGDEWDKDTGIYREARRYRGKVYREFLRGDES